MFDVLKSFFPILIALSVLFVTWWLYAHGHMAIRHMTALLFVCTIRRDHCTASFSHCNGIMRRGLPLRRIGSFSFSLDSSVTQGTVRIEVQDSHKVPLIALDESHPSGRIDIQKGERYFLFLRFEKAQGHFTLAWE